MAEGQTVSRIGQDRADLLEEIFVQFSNYADYFAFTAFEIDNQDKIKTIDSLLGDGTLYVEGGKLRFSFKHYRQSKFWDRDEKLLERLLPFLKEMYSAQPEGMHPLESLRGLMAKRGAALGLKPVDFQRALILLQKMGLVGGTTEAATENGGKAIDTFQLNSVILRPTTIAAKLQTDETQGHFYLTGTPPAQALFTSQQSSGPAGDGGGNVQTGLGRWEVIKPLGQGGQGAVSLVWNAESLPKTLATIQDAVSILSSIQSGDKKLSSARQLAEAVAAFGPDKDHGNLGALKQLHSKGTDAYAKALKRMQSELRALRQITHPHVVRLYDENLEEGWYVMEYFPGGTLADHREDFRGNVPQTLTAFRSLVEAMKLLHDANLVHRDIKPENIYVRANGQLVVGDLGLVFFADGDARVTATYENVGSRDWMPTWASGERQETVTKAFDVFGLGKLLWSMLSGKTKLRLWYFDRPEYDLTKLFPDQPEMTLVNNLLRKCVVEHEEHCLIDAAALLAEIDALQGAVRRGAPHLDPKATRRCKVCDQGKYQEFRGNVTNFGLEPRGVSGFKVLTCNHCGHVELFHFPERDNPLPGWKA